MKKKYGKVNSQLSERSFEQKANDLKNLIFRERYYIRGIEPKLILMFYKWH